MYYVNHNYSDNAGSNFRVHKSGSG